MFFFLSSAVQMMAHPGAIAGVPVGLEYLTQVDQLICKQIVELFEGLFVPFLLMKAEILLFLHYFLKKEEKKVSLAI